MAGWMDFGHMVDCLEFVGYTPTFTWTTKTC